MADFNLFESSATAESEDRVRRAANERALKEAAFDVRRQFGAYLGNAESTTDYDERFSYVENNIATVLHDKVEPTTQVLSWIKTEFMPDSVKPIQSADQKHGKLARRGDERSAPRTANTKQARDPRTVIGGIDWQWDNDSNSFKSTKSSNFQCVCGSAVQGVGQHSCDCGRLWNLSSIADGNKTAATPTFVCREVMRRDVHLAKKSKMVDVTSNSCDCCDHCTNPGCDCCKKCSSRTSSATTADKIDPKDPHKHEDSDEWEYSDGYDVKGLLGPAAGEEEHDGHLSALDLIFAADDDFPEENPSGEVADNGPGDEEGFAEPAPAPAPMVPPMPPAQPSGMDMLNGDPAGIENQPAEDADIQQAQQTILDMILREKAEEVTNDENNDDEIENLNDAYQSLDVVQDLENAEMMNDIPPGLGMNPQLAAYQAGTQYGYVMGYLEALADNSYENRKTDFEGFEPPIEGVSNGLDDADATPGKDTTPELRNLLKDQFDTDNAANKDQKPLDPAKPFGPDHGKASRFNKTR